MKSLNNLGFCYHWKLQLDAAVQFYDLALKSIEQADKNNQENKQSIIELKPHILSNLGELLYQQNKLKESETTLEEALKIYNNDPSQNELALASCLHILSNIYYAQKNMMFAEGKEKYFLFI